MPVSADPILLDATRLISRSWTGRRSTGIDRVCYAYLDHFRHRACAVIQHRGVVRVLDRAQSEVFFDMLLLPTANFRIAFARWLPPVLAKGEPGVVTDGLTYINVSHTEFDLPSHWDWVARSGVRSVKFIHDLIPILHPEFSRPRAVKRHLGRVQQALRNADHLVTSSRTVEEDLRDFARSEGIKVPPLTVAPLAGQLLPSRKPRQASSTQPYFLCVGTIEPRKNHGLLLAVWRELVRRHGKHAPKLILVGQKGPLTGALLDPLKKSRALRRHVELHDSCSDDELGALMAGCSALLLPSRAEGYGLPLVEGLQLGRPVLASDIAIFREVGQGIPRLLDPASESAWVNAIESLLSNPEALADGNASRKSFRSSTWPEHFARLETALTATGLQTDAACESSLAA